MAVHQTLNLLPQTERKTHVCYFCGRESKYQIGHFYACSLCALVRRSDFDHVNQWYDGFLTPSQRKEQSK